MSANFEKFYTAEKVDRCVYNKYVLCPEGDSCWTCGWDDTNTELREKRINKALERVSKRDAVRKDIKTP